MRAGRGGEQQVEHCARTFRRAICMYDFQLDLYCSAIDITIVSALSLRLASAPCFIVDGIYARLFTDAFSTLVSGDVVFCPV